MFMWHYPTAMELNVRIIVVRVCILLTSSTLQQVVTGKNRYFYENPIISTLNITQYSSTHFNSPCHQRRWPEEFLFAYIVDMLTSEMVPYFSDLVPLEIFKFFIVGQLRGSKLKEYLLIINNELLIGWNLAPNQNPGALFHAVRNQKSILNHPLLKLPR